MLSLAEAGENRLLMRRGTIKAGNRADKSAHPSQHGDHPCESGPHPSHPNMVQLFFCSLLVVVVPQRGWVLLLLVNALCGAPLHSSLPRCSSWFFNILIVCCTEWKCDAPRERIRVRKEGTSTGTGTCTHQHRVTERGRERGRTRKRGGNASSSGSSRHGLARK